MAQATVRQTPRVNLVIANDLPSADGRTLHRRIAVANLGEVWVALFTSRR
jgi:hypothetical protein